MLLKRISRQIYSLQFIFQFFYLTYLICLFEVHQRRVKLKSHFCNVMATNEKAVLFWNLHLYQIWMSPFSYQNNWMTKSCWYILAFHYLRSFFKVHIFWEGHKILWNLYRRFDRYYIGFRKISVSFSECMNFKTVLIYVLRHILCNKLTNLHAIYFVMDWIDDFHQYCVKKFGKYVENALHIGKACKRVVAIQAGSCAQCTEWGPIFCVSDISDGTQPCVYNELRAVFFNR